MNHQLDIVDGATGLRLQAEVIEPPGAAVNGAAPLALFSHGNGGSWQIYRALLQALVDAGWVVAAFDHPGNHRRDDSLRGTRRNLEDRPRHVSLVVDAVLAQRPIDDRRIAVIGHSLGGTTALALAGAIGHTRDGDRLRVQPDPRVRALVLLTPATAFFAAPQALRAVDLPVLLLEAEHDELTPGWHGRLVIDGVADPRKVSHRVEAGAGHFSFISPFPAALRKPGFAPANDPPGFDRAAFHRRYPAEIVAWLDRVLPPARPLTQPLARPADRAAFGDRQPRLG